MIFKTVCVWHWVLLLNVIFDRTFFFISFSLKTCRLCLTGGPEPQNGILDSMQDLAKVFSSYLSEVLVIVYFVDPDDKDTRNLKRNLF